jgi:hypothetical protein
MTHNGPIDTNAANAPRWSLGVKLGSAGLHGQQRDGLEEVVLNHVAQAARGFVKRAALLHAESLGEGYLDAGHVVAVPDRLQERIGEAEIEDIHDRFLPQEVVDAKDRIFREHRPRHAVELSRRGQVAPERLLHNYACMIGQARRAESGNDRRKERGRDSQVVRRAARAPQRLLDLCERALIVIVPTPKSTSASERAAVIRQLLSRRQPFPRHRRARNASPNAACR